MCCKSGASYHKSLMRLTGCGTPVDTLHVAFSYKAQHPMHPSPTEKETVMRSQPASLLAQHEVQHLLLGAAGVGEKLLQGGQALLGGWDARQPVSRKQQGGKVWAAVGMGFGCPIAWKRTQRRSPAKQIQNIPASFTQWSEPRLKRTPLMVAQSPPHFQTQPRSAVRCNLPVSCRQTSAPPSLPHA